ncbi:MAG: DUF1887 family protein [Lachnospiraceae bacterium]|nr:DUF1887 family protein [Lachnospiraceae bacterium]
MVVNYEFLGSEPIENVITCLHFKIDKVVFFGYHEEIREQKNKTENFLRQYCGVREVIFQPLYPNDLQAILRTMRSAIERELDSGAKLFFDITGGESLILVAFGILSKQYDTSMHIYDVPKNQLIELDDGAGSRISRDAEAQHVELDLDKYVEMHGGKINYLLQKSLKEISDEEFDRDVAGIWEVASRFSDQWNPFSDFLRAHMVPDEDLQVNRKATTILHALSESKGKLTTPAKLNQILDALAEKGVILDLKHEDGEYRLRFKNQYIKECLWDGGSILEWHVFQEERRTSGDCRIGVHLDWDGIVHSQAGVDVLNEIDVLSLTGCVPTFISCKSGEMASRQTLHALYELDTVAKRFGGKYAKKVLVTTKGLSDVYLERAAEMGIEVR